MRYVLVVIAVVLVAWLAVGQAPAPTPAPAAAGGRIGVVNSDRIIVESNEGKVLQKELETKFAPRQKELQARAAEMEKLQTELQQKQASMSDAERQRRALEIQQKQKSLERLNEDVTADFNAERDQVLRRLAKRIQDVIQKYGAEKQYALILDANQAGTLYAGPGSDITNEVMAAFNAAAPAK